MRARKSVLFASLIAILVSLSSVFFVQPQSAFACVNPDGEQNQSEFLGLKSWHYYLPCDDSGGVDNDIELDQLWLIGLAVFEATLFVGAVLAVVFVIWGGVKYIMSQGNAEGTSSARKTIINAIAGLVITVSASVLVTFMINLLAGGSLVEGGLNVPNASESGVVDRVLDFVYATIAIISVIYVVIGSINFATSAGDPQKANNARNTIIYAIVGLVIVVSASAITSFVFTEVPTGLRLLQDRAYS